MEWQQIGEIILAIITAVLGGGGASVHFKHKNKSNNLEAKLGKLKTEIAVLQNTNEFIIKDFKEMVEDIKYIRRKLDGGK